MFVKRALDLNAVVFGSDGLGRFRVIHIRAFAADLLLPGLLMPSPLLGSTSASATVDVVTPLTTRPDFCLGSQSGAQWCTLGVCKYSFALSFLGCLVLRNSKQVTKCPRLTGVSRQRRVTWQCIGLFTQLVL